MTEQEYLKLKEQIKTHASRRRSEIDNDERKQLESLETVWNLVSSMGEHQGQPTNGPSPQGAFPLAEAIRQVLPLLIPPFSINDAMQLIEQKGYDVKKPMNPTSVSGALRKLQEAGTLELVEAGKGKRPSLYRIAKGKELSSVDQVSLLEQKGQAAVPAAA